MLNEEDGKFLLKLARKTIEDFLSGKEPKQPDRYPKSLDEKHGVFCTLNKKVGDEYQLRGCIGIPYPVMPLIKAVMSAAVSSTQDPRFPRLERSELNDIKIEISVLTEPELIEVDKPEEYLEKIKIGKDGLIIEYGFNSGLLLPQVATEYDWSVEEFLDNLCLKAGLPPGAWKERGVKIYKFQAQIFKER